MDSPTEKRPPKKDSNTDFVLLILRNFYEQFFYRTLPVAASGNKGSGLSLSYGQLSVQHISPDERGNTKTVRNTKINVLTIDNIK